MDGVHVACAYTLHDNDITGQDTKKLLTLAESPPPLTGTVLYPFSVGEVIPGYCVQVAGCTPI